MQRKKISLFFIPVIMFFISSCKSGDGQDANADQPTLPNSQLIDLNQYGYPLSIEIPDSTAGTAEIVAQSWGAVEINIPEVFHISIRVGDGELTDMTFQKSMIEGNELPKFKQYLVNEPKTIVYEAEITAPEYHFYHIAGINGSDYVIENIKDTQFSQQQIENMLKYAQTLKAKEKVK